MVHHSSKSNPSSPRISKISTIKYKNGDIVRLRATISDRYIFKNVDPSALSDPTTPNLPLSPVSAQLDSSVDIPNEEMIKSEKKPSSYAPQNMSALSRSTPTSPLGNHKLNINTRHIQQVGQHEIQSLPSFIPHRIKLTDRSNFDRSESTTSHVTSILIPPTIVNGSKPTSLAVRADLKLKRKNATPCLATSVIRFSKIWPSGPPTQTEKNSEDLHEKASINDYNRSLDDELLLKAVLDDDQATFLDMDSYENLSQENVEHMNQLQNEIDKIVQLKLTTRHSEVITTKNDVTDELHESKDDGIITTKWKGHSKQYSDSSVILQNRRHDLEDNIPLNQTTIIHPQ